MILIELCLDNHLLLNDFSIASALLSWQNLDVGKIVAQSVSDPNVLGQMVSMWNTFIKSGQIWALLMGLVFGYLLRGITA
jgi:hypothetical protein